MLSVNELRDGILSGSRRHLAKAITLIESKRDEDRSNSLSLLSSIYPHRANSLRIGISGSPGVGKSTFIETFGKFFIENNHKLAVLTVDPSSPRSAGSILGDKTRMEVLSQHPNCYIRPSPAGLSLGGVTRRTREAIILCEAAGFDTILIETVGVGQSEHAISTMVDIFMFLTLPHSGDQLQGIKRGILELSDLVVVTKADGDLEHAARQASVDHQMALHYLRPDLDRLQPKVFQCSSVTNKGIDEIYAGLFEMLNELKLSGRFERRRRSQLKTWYESEAYEQVLEKIMLSDKIKSRFNDTEKEMLDFKIPPPVAASNILSSYLRQMGVDIS